MMLVRLAVALCAVAIVCVGSPTVSAVPDDRLVVGGGAGVAMLHGVPVQVAYWAHLCTLAAVGYDADDNLVGITNAHCSYDTHGNQWLGDEVVHAAHLNEPEPGGVNVEVIGTVAYISGGNPVVPGPNGVGLDYAVIVFDKSMVIPTATIGDTTIRRIAEPPPPGTVLCKQGVTTGRTCGVMIGTIGPYILNTVTEFTGDSGAPIVVDDAVVGIQWVTGAASSMTAIMADLDSRGGVGSGFRLVTS
ncbi:peptidase S1 [Nocardia uniformis]|uniref:Peptidase S1 n=2 Tax=Nocardia uniformis TaxID=53432 RepID=A0A849C5R3_9NOCA|nr:peptidase S1 [Nocardia uniformis]NNH70259.1 peptidase S1 [Nocardia uniformis]